jgi:hypothetical protein
MPEFIRKMATSTCLAIMIARMAGMAPRVQTHAVARRVIRVAVAWNVLRR